MYEEIKHVSISQVDMFRRCPKQWMFKYVRGYPTNKSAGLTLGTSIHEALAEANLYRQGGIQLNETVLPRLIDVAKVQAIQDIGDADTTSTEFVWDECTDMMTLEQRIESILNTTLPQIEGSTAMPLYVEYEFPTIELPSTGIPLMGYIDLVDANGVVWDYKVSGKKKSQLELDQSTQLSVYLYAIHEDGGDAGILHIDKKKGGISVLPTRHSRDKVLSTIEGIDGTVAMMQTGVYAPNPEGWHCTPGFCSFYNICRQGNGNE